MRTKFGRLGKTVLLATTISLLVSLMLSATTPIDQVGVVSAQFDRPEPDPEDFANAILLPPDGLAEGSVYWRESDYYKFYVEISQEVTASLRFSGVSSDLSDASLFIYGPDYTKIRWSGVSPMFGEKRISFVALTSGYFYARVYGETFGWNNHYEISVSIRDTSIRITEKQSLESRWATIIPTVDGLIGPDEWAGAGEYGIHFFRHHTFGHLYDFKEGDTTDKLSVYIKNDSDFLYLCIDAVIDMTADHEDSATLRVDVGYDGAHEDGDAYGYGVQRGEGWHNVFREGGEVEPWYGPSIVEIVSGFSSTPNSQIPHRVYEFKIPLAGEEGISTPPGQMIGILFRVHDADESLDVHTHEWPYSPSGGPKTFTGLKVALGTAVQKQPTETQGGQPIETYIFVMKWGTDGSSDGQLESPRGVTVDGDGFVYVADTDNCRIQKFDSNGSFISKWGSRGSGDGELDWPRGVAVDDAGFVYVADSSNHRIQKFDSNGNFITKWGSEGIGKRQFKYPHGVAVDADGFVYVVDTVNWRIQKFDSNGNFISMWGSEGTGDGQFYYPYDIAVDRDDFVYVADTYNWRIQKFDSSGNFITKWGGQGSGDGEFRYPRSVAVAGDFVYVLDEYRIQKFDSNGNFIIKWMGQDSEAGRFITPTGVAVDDAGFVYVADTGNWRILKFDSNSNFIAKWGTEFTGDGQFYYPSDAAVDKVGFVYVADRGNNRIQKFDSNGSFITTWGSPGSGDGQFDGPSSVAVDGDGFVYVADTDNCRIQKFDSNGSFINKWGSRGSGDGEFDGPMGVAVDDAGFVYVADRSNHRIQKFDSNGKFITNWETGFLDGSEPSCPYDVAVDRDGFVYFTYGRDRIVKFDSNGNFILKWGSEGSGDGQFFWPGDIVVDEDGFVYVSDSGNHRIQKFDSNGNFITKWGRIGSGDGELERPSSVAIEEHGIVYVVDNNNWRIQKFARVVPEQPVPQPPPDLEGKIVFMSDRDGNEEIYVMNADGTGQVRLTNDPAYDEDPSWSPDGRRIAFTSYRDGNREIYVMNADGTGQVNLTGNAAVDGYPFWSPDGKRIAFASDRDGDYEIYVMNADGTEQVRLTNNPADDVGGSWSPDGRTIAFASDRDGDYEIYVMNADGSGQVNLMNNRTRDVMPSWSPDGRRIAFTSYRDGNSEIYVMNADGTGQMRLTNNPTDDWVPSWSPDGRRIAFMSYRDGDYEIYVMNADGTGQVNLTNNPAGDGLPSWSSYIKAPEEPPQQPLPALEDKIAFESDRDGNWEIYVMNADGTGQVRLTDNPAYDYTPSWSPDGRKIAFESDRDGKWDIYIMNADGTGQLNLTDDLAHDSWPFWSPDGRRIAFISYYDGNDEIYTVNIDGTEQVNLTNNPAHDYAPSWSPDGRRIAFESNRDGNGEIYVMNADGTKQVNLTNSPADDCWPFWLPDGERIAFHSYRDGNYEIYVMNADGSGQVNLTNNPADDGMGSWSPDGRRIVFESCRDGNWEIYVMNADGTGQVNLTNNPAHDGQPSWSPDGQRVTFESYRDGNWEIYVMNADGTGQVNLTDNRAYDDDSSWSPYPEAPEAAALIVKHLLTDRAQYYANEPITFRFTVRNQTASPVTFKPVIKIVDTNGVTTAFTSQRDYTLEAQQEMPIEHVQAPKARPWTEGVTRWQVLLIGPPPHYEERYAETDLVGEFLVVPAATGAINARITSLDISPVRVQIGDTLAIRFTIENTGERGWSFLVDASIWGPGGYVDQLRQTISVPRGQVSPPSTFDWPVPTDAPAGTYDVELRVYQEAMVLDWWEAVASFMVDKEYSYVETREFVGPLGKRVAIHFHHAPGDVPGSLLLLNVLQKLKWLVSLYGAGSGGVLETISAAVDTYAEVAPHLLAETSTDGSLDLLFLQLEDRFNIGFLYNGVSFLDAGGKLIPPATLTWIGMRDIPAPGYWRLIPGTPVVGSSLEHLAERYAPILYLHRDEVYVPDPMGLMLDHASLREERAGVEPGPEILPRGTVTAKTFDTNNRPDYYLDLEPDLQSLQARGEIRGCAGSPPYQDLYQRIHTQEDSVIYVRAVQGPDWLVIQYWLFYFYNDWCNKHEGDWELVEVVFENVSSAEQVLASEMEPSYVAYSHHLGGERVPWSKAIWVQDGSAKRPLVFVALGSHANYPSPGWRFQLLGWDEAEGSQRVDAKLLPIPQTEDGGLLPEGKWAKFIGRWGESGTGLSLAPIGLLAREAWQDPYEWAMNLPESDPTEDGRALWAWVGSPVELHVYDAQGRHVGPNRAGGIDLEIPGAEYETDVETGHSLVKIPDFESEQGYRITLKGTGAGTADLVVAIPDAEGKQQQVVEFTKVAVRPGLQAELEVTGKLDSPLKVDADGDGVFEVRREADETQEITLEVKAARPEGAGLWDRYSWLLVPLLLSGAAVLLIVVSIRAFAGRRRTVEPSGVRCSKCGNLNRSDARFCKYCGSELRSGRR